MPSDPIFTAGRQACGAQDASFLRFASTAGLDYFAAFYGAKPQKNDAESAGAEGLTLRWEAGTITISVWCNCGNSVDKPYADLLFFARFCAGSPAAHPLPAGALSPSMQARKWAVICRQFVFRNHQQSRGKHEQRE